MRKMNKAIGENKLTVTIKWFLWEIIMEFICTDQTTKIMMLAK